jgi:hypothetical protein
MELKNLVWVAVAGAGLGPCASWSAGESAAASAPQPSASLSYFTPNFYPAEKAWLVTGGLSQGNASIESVSKVLALPLPATTLNLSEHATVAASTLRYGLSSQSELMVSVTYLAASTLYETSWSMPQLAYAYRITPPDSRLKSNLTATYIPRSLYDGPFSGPARYKLGGVSSYEVAPESWVSLGLEHRLKASEKFPAYLQMTGSVTRQFSATVVSAGVSAKKQDKGHSYDGTIFDGASVDAYWTRGINLGISQKIDAKRGVNLILAQERLKTYELVGSVYGSMERKNRIKSSSAVLSYYQAF